ncbi:50S ribosomal protein L10 [Candidatus Uhrbacteria bacterium]|nr:50S ribosomal protein L10 [Candidatus Uhrbacteria bacterium]
MAKSRQQKELTKEQLVSAFKGAKSVVFADYQGLKVPQADSLRKHAREANIQYIVAKKSLFTLAAKEAGINIDAKNFPGMLGAAFGKEDEVAPAKVLGDASKGTTLKLVGGIFEGAAVDAEKVNALSKLPGKQQLLGMLVGTMYAPVSAFVRALNAIAEKNGTPAAPAPAPEAAPVVEATPAAPAPEAEAPAAEPTV